MTIGIVILALIFAVDLPWVLLVLPVVLPLVWLVHHRRTRENIKRYEQERKSYRDEQERHQKRMRRYEKLLENLTDYQRENFRPRWDTLHQAKQGKWEHLLRECLIQRLGDQIVQGDGQPAIKSGFDPPADFYTVDMAYWDGQVLIDIEVDEPYFNGKPIHHQGADDRRDNLFQQRGWVIVRFTERQAKCQPLACCRVLVETVNQMRQRLGIEPLKLVILDRITPEPHWTEQDALQLAAQNFRDSY